VRCRQLVDAREDAARLQAVVDDRASVVEEGAAALRRLESATKQVRAETSPPCVKRVSGVPAASRSEWSECVSWICRATAGG
jgi:hypothetical protein